MGTRLLWLSLIVLLLAACGDNSNESISDAHLPQPPTSLDLAIPPELQDVLANPDSATLYTVGREHEFNAAVGAEARAPVPADVERISEYYVIDRVELPIDEVTLLVDSFKTAYFAGETGGVACFYPHHALRLTKGELTIDMLICFKCHNYKITPDGGYNNVHMSRETGMEDTWRSIVRKHKLRDVSDKEEK